MDRVYSESAYGEDNQAIVVVAKLKTEVNQKC